MSSTSASRILRTFRSHKSLKSEARSQATPRERRPSECSTISASSMDSSNTSISVEWDPLRLHPPMMASRPPTSYQTPEEEMRRHTHHYHNHTRSEPHPPTTRVRAARSVHNMKVRNAWAFQPAGTTSSVEIYDGFDFGFDGSGSEFATPLAPPPVRRQQQPKLEDWSASPSPTSDRSYDSAIDGPSSAGSSPSDSEWGGVSPVTPRPHPAGMDEADYFMKRGHWKRRGIVFSKSEPAEEGIQEQCFNFERMFI